MDTMTDIGVDLDQLYLEHHDDACTVRDHARHGETCSVTARWACYGPAECSTAGLVRDLWCDVRHQAWFTYGELCECGRPAAAPHWTVVPL